MTPSLVAHVLAGAGMSMLGSVGHDWINSKRSPAWLHLTCYAAGAVVSLVLKMAGV